MSRRVKLAIASARTLLAAVDRQLWRLELRMDLCGPDRARASTRPPVRFRAAVFDRKSPASHGSFWI